MRASGRRHLISDNRYFVVMMLTVVYGLNFLDRQLLSILAEPVKNDLGLSDTQLGLLGGLTFALFYTCFGIPLAWLADRSNRVRIVAASCALWSIFTGACGLAQNFPQLALARMGVGIGEAGGSPPSYSIISDYFPPERRAGAFAMFALGVPLGTTAGAALGGWIAVNYGWRSAFLAIGTFGALFALLVLLTVSEPERGRLDAAPAVPSSLRNTLREFATNPVLRLTTLGGSLSAFVGYAMLSWTPALMMREKGMSLGDLALYYSVMSGAATVVGTLTSGYLVDRLGALDRRWYAIVPAAAFAIAAPFFAAGVGLSGWLPALLLMSVPLALYVSYLAPAIAVVQNAVQPAQRSTASAILQFAFSIVGLGGGPVYVGIISDASARAGFSSPLEMGMLALVPVFLLAALVHALAARALRLADATSYTA